MSSNQHDHTIHPGNYEEFFLLYVDGELSPAQAEAVEAFVAAHPDLRTELELLKGACLTPETFSFPKEGLLAHNMEQSVIDEDLFLYMDDELPADRKARVEEDLAARPAYRRQLDGLLQTRLDPSQTIAHPNKKELYRREERRAAFPWMRVAAAVAVAAIGGFLYWNGNSRPAADTVALRPPVQNTGSDNRKAAPSVRPADETATPLVAQGKEPATDKQAATAIGHRAARTINHDAPVRRDAALAQSSLKAPQTAVQDNDADNANLARVTTAIDARVPALALEPARLVASTINNSPVTSALHNRNTTSEAITTAPDNSADVAAGNEHKGSVKGFLRKATRLIEKRTGVDPTNDGELLIGVVAVKLK